MQLVDSGIKATQPAPLRLVKSGREYFSLLEQIILEAEKKLHLQIYIFEDDETGQKIAQALIAAVKRGVKVFLVADGYASQNLSASFIDHLRSAGIHFRFFNPLLKSKFFYFGRRMHHKVVVADGNKALVGGINFSNNYNDTLGSSAWLDLVKWMFSF